MSGVVIIGGGQGGYLTAASLRQYRFTGSITIVTDEEDLPYQLDQARWPELRAALLEKAKPLWDDFKARVPDAAPYVDAYLTARQ